ncbi:MAG: hypothetical protein ACRYGM_03735 [Janthinobacterium lividum]
MKLSRKKTLLLGGILLVAAGAAGTVAIAQRAPGRLDPSTLAEFHGKVTQYEVTPRGDVDGLILADGTEVHFPPHLGTQVTAIVQPGADVTLRAEKNGTVLRAALVKDDASGKSVVDRGPPAPGTGAGLDGGPGRDPGRGPGRDRGPAELRAPGQALQSEGVVKMQLHGPRGEMNGVLLQDGTMVHLPPREASRLASQLQPGRAVAVRGDGFEGAVGRSINAREFGPSMDKLAQLDNPAPRGPAGPALSAPSQAPDQAPAQVPAQAPASQAAPL